MASNSSLLNGRIEKTDLPTLLRTAEKEKLSGELSFSKQGQRIDLYFLFGQLYHSKWGGVIGIDAVSELLGWTTGNYAFTEGIIPAQASINDDIDRILASSPNGQATVQQTQSALIPRPEAVSYSAPPSADGGDFMSDLAPFDLASLDSSPSRPPEIATFGAEPMTPQSKNFGAMTFNPTIEEYNVPPVSDPRHAPSPPANGLYRTRYFCLPNGEPMSTSMLATGPQLEEELAHMAEVGFTGYLLGGPEIEGLPTVGICLFKGRFIHAFYHSRGQSGVMLTEGERAYRSLMEQSGHNASRFYWFYEITLEVMRAAIALLTPPTRYAHLEVRIIRFKELLRMLSEESHTGCVRISLASNAKGTDGRQSHLAGECAYIPIFKGGIMGLWTESSPRLTNDGQLLQRFLNEPQAFLDLHTTAQVNEPGLPLESLFTSQPKTPNYNAEPEHVLPAQVLKANIAPALIQQAQQGLHTPPPESVTPIDDDERQLTLITAISRMESTWTQAQKKGRVETHASLLMLAGFANDVLSLNDSVNGHRMVVDMIGRAMKQEFAPFRMLLQNVDLTNGRINLVKLLKEYDLYTNQGEQAGLEYSREASRALRTVIRSNFQNYVSLIRQEGVRFECQEIYEIFLQDVVKRI